MAVKRIGVLTGGGDCPGLNPTIKGVVMRAADYGIEVLGLQNGWKSLVSDEPIYTTLTVDDVRPIIKQGGTILHTSRTNAYNKNNPEYLPNLVKNFDRLGLDALVPLCRALGLSHTALNRRMLDTAAREAGRENFTTATETASARKRSGSRRMRHASGVVPLIRGRSTR